MDIEIALLFFLEALIFSLGMPVVLPQTDDDPDGGSEVAITSNRHLKPHYRGFFLFLHILTLVKL